MSEPETHSGYFVGVSTYRAMLRHVWCVHRDQKIGYAKREVE